MPYNPQKSMLDDPTVNAFKATPGGGYDPYDPRRPGVVNPLLGPGAGAAGTGTVGEPKAPSWGDFTNPILSDLGKLNPDYAMNVESLAGYDQFRDLATGTGLSPWGQAATDRLGQQEAFAREGAQRAGQSAIQQAIGNLERTGGLTSGARERLQAGGLKDILKSRQAIAGQGLLGRADISMQDAAARQKALGGLLDYGTRARQFDIGTRTGGRREQMDFEMDKYKTDIAKYLAERKSEDIKAQIAGMPKDQGLISDSVPLLGIF